MLTARHPSLPSLRSLRAFEAAARHSSFVKAADELGVTPGAIAQQVRHLEDWLGQRLFVRHAHGITPTANTKAVRKQLSHAFDQLSGTVQVLRATTVPNEVRIAALPSIAQLWLSSRLQGMRKRFPSLEISVSALDEPPNFKRELFDLGIFYAKTAPRGSAASVILQDTLFPVCSPTLNLASIDELSKHPFIHDAAWIADWETWLNYIGARGIVARRGAVFSLYSLAIQRAVDGDGVLMGRGALVEAHLRDGRLVKPFDIEVPTEKLFLLLPVERDLPPAQAELADWLCH